MAMGENEVIRHRKLRLISLANVNVNEILVSDWPADVLAFIYSLNYVSG